MNFYDVSDVRLDPPECLCARHSEECGCEHCHECRSHDWREWTVYPLCEFCENEMLEYWADEIREAA